MTAISSESLRVLVATPLGQGGRGGIDRVMDNLAAALAADDRKVSVEILPTRGGGHPFMMVPLMARFLARLFVGRIAGTIDLVHINVAQRGSIKRKALLAIVCTQLRIPYVLHVHGSQFHHSWEKGGQVMRKRMRRLIGDAARVIVLGNFWRDFIVRLGADPLRLVIVPNATVFPASANDHKTDQPARILFLGKIGARKGVPQLVEALRRLKEVGGWQATLAGDGEVEQTREHIAQLGLADRVNVLGWTDPESVVRLQASHGILVLPSFNENLPMSVIEGMAHGMAVVATPVGAVTDLIEDGESGILVPPGDITALADALRRCVEDPALRLALGSRARAFHACHLDLAAYAGRVIAVWRAAVASGSAT